MKKTFLVTLLILMGAWTISAQTEGTLTLTATTSDAGGNYATRTTHASRTCTWNATNLSGAVVPDGICLVRITTGNGVVVRKILKQAK